MTIRKFNDTKVKANVATMINGQLEVTEYELYVPYIRTTAKNATEKAIKAVREALELDANAMIGIIELENEKTEQKRYNNGKVYDYCIADFAEESEAKAEAEKDENLTVKKIAWYQYECAYWAYWEYDEENDEYETDFVHDESPLNMTKTEMRSFLKMSAENLTGKKIIGIHNENKNEIARYCVIEKDELEKCIIKK